MLQDVNRYKFQDNKIISRDFNVSNYKLRENAQQITHLA